MSIAEQTYDSAPDHAPEVAPPTTPKTTLDTVRTLQEKVYALLDDGEMPAQQSGAAACLRPLLAAYNWTGEKRQLNEALPHFDEIYTVNDLRAVLARLHLESIAITRQLNALDGDTLPCLYEAVDGNLYVIIQRLSASDLLIFDGKTNAFLTAPIAFIGPGQTYLIQSDIKKTGVTPTNEKSWVKKMVGHFRPMFLKLMVVSFAINLLALTPPIYAMVVYDKALGASSLMTLGYLFAGIALALCAEVYLRNIRSKYLAYLGSRMEYLVTTGVFEKLLNLPLTMSESAAVGTQITRLKRFENVRDLFSGGLAGAILDLPFIVVFLAAIFAIGGVVGWIPVALIATYAVIAAICLPIMRVRMKEAAVSQVETRNFLIECLSKRDAIRGVGAEDIWIDRYKAFTSEALAKQYASQKLTSTVQSIAQALMILAGAASVGLGTVFVMQQDMTTGALIAVMTLVWRLLSPIQFAFLNLNTFCSARDTISQINSLMSLTSEIDPSSTAVHNRKFNGKLDMRRVAMRFPNKPEPVLRGIDLSIGAGEFVTVTGPSGAGKSVLLKVLARLYQPQVGAIALDTINLRQLEVAELRREIGFLSDRPTFFYGTIYQNFKLSNPGASRLDMEEALDAIGALDQINELPDGLDTRLSANPAHIMSQGLAQQIAIAQTLVKKPSIYLMDEPGKILDLEADQALLRLFKKIKGSSTIVAVTQRPSHMNISDRIVVMKNGLIAGEGPPQEILPKILNV